jgi:hypothetical protein
VVTLTGHVSNYLEKLARERRQASEGRPRHARGAKKARILFRVCRASRKSESDSGAGAKKSKVLLRLLPLSPRIHCAYDD